MTGSVFIIKGLVKILVFVNLSKFGHQFSCAQKRLPTSKMPCIIPCQQQQSNTRGSQQNSYRQQATNYQRYPHKSGYTPNIQQRDINLKRRRNPCNRNGVQLRCNICESIYHFEQQCPEVKTTDLYLTHEVILFESDYDHPAKLKNLVSDSWNAALFDSGATKTVAGEIWFNSFIQSLNKEEKVKTETSKSNNMYCFGDGNPSHFKCKPSGNKCRKTSIYKYRYRTK